MAGIYSSPAYDMGDDVVAHTDTTATAPVTADMARQAALELKRMRASLTSWLKYRRINDAIAQGKAGALKKPLFKRPGARPPAPQVMQMTLMRQRYAAEQELAAQLHVLLSEVMDASQLPNPDLSENPNAAAQLAFIAISGKLPGEQVAPSEQGLVWLWPLVVIVGAVAFTVTSAIRSNADVAKEKEHYECVKAGACTDSGFWFKVGALAVVGWLVWDKAGLGQRVKGAFK